MKYQITKDSGLHLFEDDVDHIDVAKCIGEDVISAGMLIGMIEGGALVFVVKHGSLTLEIEEDVKRASVDEKIIKATLGGMDYDDKSKVQKTS